MEDNVPTTVEISDGNRHKIVHINRLQHRLQPMEASRNSLDIIQTWHPPQIEHFINETPEVRRNPPRNRQPPDYYRPD